MASTALDKALRDREALKVNIGHWEVKLQGHKPGTSGLLPLRKVTQYLSCVEGALVKLTEIHERIYQNVEPLEMSPHNTELCTLHDRLVELDYGFELIKESHQPIPLTTERGTITSVTRADIRLPKLELPTFDGTSTDWMSFRDMFSAAVHTSLHLTPAQKLSYLKSSLTGEASRQVKSLSLTDTNYDIAWKMLNDRYQNDRELLFSILRRFTGQQPIQAGSANSLRSLVDVTKESIRSLEMLKLPVEKWDGILLFTIFQKLDPSSRELWEQTLKDSSIPPLQEFLDFLEQRARALAAGGSLKLHQPKQSYGGKTDFDAGHRRINQVHHVQSAVCKLCSGDHFISKCAKFVNFSIPERIECVRRQSLCYNCFRDGHSAYQCPGNSTCKTCKGRHNTMIHKNREEVQRVDDQQQSKQELNLQSHHVYDDVQIQQTMLATAVVKVRDSYGEFQTCRAFLDGGSSVNLITEACVQRLGLGRSHTQAVITGLATTSCGIARGKLSVTFTSRFDSSVSYCVTFLILPKITGRLPAYPCDPTVWSHVQGLELADPNFNVPSNIDILLGQGVFWKILLDGSRTGPIGAPVARRSTLGWLIGGDLDAVSTTMVPPIHVHIADTDLDERLQQFWELESVPTSRVMTLEEKACEDHFQNTHSIDLTGRFTVKLPFKNPRPVIGPSREIAIRRLKQLESRLLRQPQHREDYNKFMEEYLSLGHMVKVPSDEVHHPKNEVCYIPHHPVFKESSTTTKFRVVFDASAKTSSGVSLNDSMMVGPVVQDNLIDILLRFRKHPIAFTADIAKMYRQIKVTSEDSDMQRIVWRDDPSQPIQDFKLGTVTYGTASAPYLATKTLQQLAVNHQDSHPLASKILLEDTFVDDCMSGAQKPSEAIRISSELLSLTSRGGFSLRKWSSNCSELLLSLPPDLRETQPLLQFDSEQTVKSLGIHWCTTQDHVLFKVTLPEPEPLKVGGGDLTKRKLLSEMSKTFDPMGWLSPAIIKAKILIQQLWKLNLGWDVILPIDIQQQWVKFKTDLPLIEQIRINRCVVPHHSCRVSLVGFCDASERAYAAVVYIRAEDVNQLPTVTLVMAKTRVAPVKQVSLPRLELCGAVLLSQLMSTVQRALKMDFDSVSAWTDSTVVLSWIQCHPSRWKTFIANRVTEIQERVPATHWGHVSGIDNPADCASRGLDPLDLINHDLWWTGPSWLSSGIIPATGKVHSVPNDIDLEERKIVLCANAATVQQDYSMLSKFSSLTRLKRITALCFRFLNNCRVKCAGDRHKGPLTPLELDHSLQVWIRRVQEESFPGEIQCIKNNKCVSHKSKLRALNPFLDSSLLLRVGGRLRHSQLPPDQRTPILLPRHHQFTELLIMSTHLINFHAGPQLVQSILTRRYWIVGARDAIRHRIKKCVTCTRYSAVTMQPFMGDLPSARVTAARAFLRCGVDYAGPFLLKPMSPRSKTTFKAYLALFVCLCTRAVHLELVSSLSTEAFLGTFRRFIARRGKPSDMYSDAGTNFVGAVREMEQMTALISSANHNNKISDTLANDGIEWHFNPPGAPHFGGLWEAGVKSVKHHLHRVMGSARLTYEEMTTTLTQIEACLNSRPLTPFSSDPSDLAVLTPGHFLIGAPLTAAPDPDVTLEKTGRLSRWQLIQQMYQSFWKRWSNEFITRLQQRPKWLNHPADIQTGNLVLIKDERLPPLKWKLGRVISIHPGADGVIRVVTLKTSDGEIKRPIVKLCLLPIDPLKSDNSENSSILSAM